MATLAHWLKIFGFDPKQCIRSVPAVLRYFRERRQFKDASGPEFEWADELPMLSERNADSGDLSAYFHQDLTVARWIHKANPRRHIDVGSRIDGFVGHLAVFREVDVIDIRPQPGRVPNVKFHALDLMAPLANEWRETTDSLSCLHTLEHFGLGRYGDSIDPNGHLAGMRQLQSMVAPGGVFYFSTPIGRQRIEFNAHRIFAVRTVLDWFAKGWTVERIAYLDDLGIVQNLETWSEDFVARNFGCETGLIILAARKLG